MKKIAIIGSEGGISCAYFVGVIFALVEKFNLTNPYIVIGSSGSTGTLAYYVAGQYASIKNIWENLLPSKKFISFWRLNKIMDIDYLIDDIFKKQDILDVGKIKLSKIKLLISATNIETGGLEYFSNQGGVDIFEALRASCATPITYNKSVKIDGHKYIDGAIGAPLSVNIEKAKQEGAEVVIAIDSSNQSIISDILLKFCSLFKNKAFRQQLKHYYKRAKYENNDKQVFILKPSVKLPISAFDNNRDHIIKTIQIGYNDVINKSALIQELLFEGV
ncbi:MAG: putative esterase of the alpha-beta hydrolase superfamily [Parcubacteria group bacterium Gr01-1014_24]|nr:MAG: putative esterase of the alpha-beta hydrolase superfamily [Parcubacteria group bacterium Gr01-1014_24]